MDVLKFITESGLGKNDIEFVFSKGGKLRMELRDSKVSNVPEEIEIDFDEGSTKKFSLISSESINNKILLHYEMLRNT